MKEPKIILISKILNSKDANNKDQGLQVFGLISDYLKSGSQVIVDFQDLDLILASFLNPIISKLYNNFDEETAKDVISNFQNLSNVDRKLVEKVEKTILKRKQAKTSLELKSTYDEILDNEK